MPVTKKTSGLHIEKNVLKAKTVKDKGGLLAPTLEKAKGGVSFGHRACRSSNSVIMFSIS